MPLVRVAIDIRPIRDFGVGTYIRNVVRILGRIDETTEYYLLGSRDRVREIGRLPDNFHIVPFTAESTTARGYFGFRQVLHHYRCDLVHIPHLLWTPLHLPCPYVVTVHDVLDFMYRAENGGGTRRAVHRYCTQYVLNNAARVLAVSQFTKKDIQRLFKIPDAKVEVVYNAIDERFREGHASAADREFIAERYQTNYPFILYAGRISPHKNVIRIIEAFSALKTELDKDGKLPDLKLIIIGDEVSRHPDLRRAVIKSGVQNDVRFLGFVPIEVLRTFYDVAKVFVVPSLYEGFGLPPLEAMAHGTPVVTSNTSSLPEVVGQGAVLVNPENVFEIMRAIHRVLIDQTLRDKIKERGYEQVQRFSWEDSVRRILRVYQEVARNVKNAADAAVRA